MNATDTVGAALTALGDPNRRETVHLLAERSRSAGELASELDVSPALLTRHLRVLREAGLVRTSLDPDDQRRHVYELVDAPLRDLRDWVDEVTAFWEQQLGAFTAHLERPNRDMEARRAKR
jgi:DNA-binding transcriptional ArsR family regulator